MAYSDLYSLWITMISSSMLSLCLIGSLSPFISFYLSILLYLSPPPYHSLSLPLSLSLSFPLLLALYLLLTFVGFEDCQHIFSRVSKCSCVVLRFLILKQSICQLYRVQRKINIMHHKLETHDDKSRFFLTNRWPLNNKVLFSLKAPSQKSDYSRNGFYTLILPKISPIFQL